MFPVVVLVHSQFASLDCFCEPQLNFSILISFWHVWVCVWDQVMVSSQTGGGLPHLRKALVNLAVTGTNQS